METIDVAAEDIDYREAIRTVEDYKPLDVQAAAMALAVCRGSTRTLPGLAHQAVKTCEHATGRHY